MFISASIQSQSLMRIAKGLFAMTRSRQLQDDPMADRSAALLQSGVATFESRLRASRGEVTPTSFHLAAAGVMTL
jgi:hypothetical protein